MTQWGIALLMTVGLAAPAAGQAELRAAQNLLRTGQYDEAIASYTRLASGSNPSLPALHGLIKARMDVGQYPQAEAAARRSPALARVLGEVLYTRGKIDEAEDAFRAATRLRGAGTDSLLAELGLAILRYERGDRAPAMQSFSRFISYYNQADHLTSEELTAIGIACWRLGRDNPQLFKDALKAFDEAVAADPGNLEPRVLAGELFLEKYNSTDAQASFQSVLAVNSNHPRARLGMARSKHFDSDPQAVALAQMALSVNPDLVPARIFVARLHLELEDYEQAIRDAEAALEINPVSLDALAILAAARQFAGDREGYEAARKRALALNPRYADLYNTLAELAVQNRLYRESVEFARAALELDEESWRGHSLLGMGLMRIGRIAEGRASLERAFAGDPYNVWTKNTLDLLDTFKNYEESRTPRFLFVIHRRESDLLTPYLAELGETAYDRLVARYRYEPPPPIRLEVFPSHADFSVRTVGLTGLGALGVSFGPVLAMDSPSARDLGHFNWGSTFWHELTHTFTLGATNNRVPRWFSEGLSVLEERRAREGWGDDVSLEFLMAFKQRKLLPIEDLNNGFVRPAFPGQVLLSYYQASLVCELIEREAGMAGLLAMLHGYRDGHPTERIFRDVLQTDLAGFDQRFEAYLRERFGSSVAALREPAALRSANGDPERIVAAARADSGSFPAQLAAGRALVEGRQFDQAVPYLQRAKRLFPEYAEGDSPYWLLAQAWKAMDRPRAAADELRQLTLINESHYQANLDLAQLLEGLGDKAGAAEALDRAVFIYPLEGRVHLKLADLYGELGQHGKAVRERRAVLALDPVDRAEARYQLARSLVAAGDLAAARREVLGALEDAPGFEKAQDLLLEIRGTLR